MPPGSLPEEAESKWVGNDWPNAMVALRSRSFADAVLYLDDRPADAFRASSRGTGGTGICITVMQ